MIRAAVVEQKAHRNAVIGYVEGIIPDDPSIPWETRARDALQKIFSEGKIPKSNVVAGLDSGETMIRTLTVPFKDEAHIRKTVKFELETQITQYAAEDLIVDFTIISETENGTVLLVAAIPKDLMRARLKAMTEGGVDPAVVDLEFFAVVRALRAAGELQQEEPVLIVHGSPKYAKLILLEDGLVRNLRTIRFTLPHQETEKIEKSKPKNTPTREIQEPVPLIVLAEEGPGGVEDLPPGSRGALIQLLSKEISRFLLGAAGTAPTQIYLTGEFESASISRMLEEATQLPVKLVDLLGAVDHPFTPEQRKGARRKIIEPLGLALRGLPDGEEGLDFRQEEFVYTRRMERVAGAALIFLELALVMIALYCLNQFFRLRDAKDATAELYQTKLQFYQAISGQDTLPLGTTPYQATLRWAQEQGGGGEYPLKRSALDETAKICEIVKRFGEAGVRRAGTTPFYLELTQINAGLNPSERSGSISIAGLISSQPNAQNLWDQFKREAFAVEPLSVQLDQKTNRWGFTIKIQKSMQ